MKVLLLNAPVFLTQQVAHRAIRPVAPATLCAVLNKAGHEAVFMDADALEWNYQKIEESIIALAPDVVGMTVLYNNRFAVFDSFEGMMKIHGHPEYGSELVWDDSISDEKAIKLIFDTARQNLGRRRTPRVEESLTKLMGDYEGVLKKAMQEAKGKLPGTSTFG